MARTTPAGLRLRNATGDDGLTGMHGPDRDGDRWRRTVIAKLDGQVVGHGTVALSAGNHEFCFCEVEVDEDYRRLGIGTAIFAELSRRTPERFTIATRVMRSHPLRRSFAESLGYGVMVHCPEPWADPIAPAWQAWIGAQSLPRRFRIVGVDDVEPSRFEKAWLDYYRWVHEAWAPVRGPDRLAAATADYRSTIDRGASALVVDRTDVVAISLVAGEVWDGRTMVICETTRSDQPDGDRLVRAAAARSLDRLGRRGVRLVEFEGHDSDAHIPGLIASFPPHDADPMDIVRLHRPNE
jgi:GNAT superfamily N-acetyltransferase